MIWTPKYLWLTILRLWWERQASVDSKESGSRRVKSLFSYQRPEFMERLVMASQVYFLPKETSVWADNWNKVISPESTVLGQDASMLSKPQGFLPSQCFHFLPPGDSFSVGMCRLLLSPAFKSGCPHCSSVLAILPNSWVSPQMCLTPSYTWLTSKFIYDFILTSRSIFQFINKASLPEPPTEVSHSVNPPPGWFLHFCPLRHMCHPSCVPCLGQAEERSQYLSLGTISGLNHGLASASSGCRVHDVVPPSTRDTL